MKKLPDIGKPIEWSDEFSVGIQEIDEQHKILVQILNELNTAIEERRGKEVRNKIMDRLVEYTRTHFTVEESLMRILGYPKYEQHKSEHEKLLSQTTDFISKINRESVSTYELLFFLRSWLINHIMGSDKAYKEHFLKKGVQTKWAETSWFDKFWK
jgi:hemerythrin